MKRILLLLFFVVYSLFAGAQTNVNADCINAIPLCNNPSFNFFQTSGAGNVIDFTSGSHNISNPTNDPFPPNFGCLKSGEYRPQWLLLTVGNAGVLEFVFGAANSPNPQAGCYDWIMWPYNASTCSGIFNNTLPPIRCNWNGTCANGTGLASKATIAAIGGDTLDFEPPLQVNACQQFIICISNYSGVDTQVSFQTLGTASLSCNPNCTPNYTMCAGGSATIVPVNYASLSSPSYSLQPGGITSTTGSFIVNPSSTQVYTTYITGTNASNAVETLTALSTVTVYSQPLAITSVTQSGCTNQATSINLNTTWVPTAPANYTINWNPIPNGIISPTATSASAIMVPGIYTVTVTGPGGCTSQDTFNVLPPPPPTIINLSPGGNYTLNCFQPTMSVIALNSAQSYTWSNGLQAPITGTLAVFSNTNIGNWTVTAVNGDSKCYATHTFVVSQDFAAPSAVISPSVQNITCTLSSIQTVTAVATPTANVTHQVLSPYGGTYSSMSHTMIYVPGGVGQFTHCAINEVNGCSSCKVFTVTSSQGFPTFSVTSTESFTLGCGTRSVANISIINASATGTNQLPNGGPVSYTLLAPGSSSVTPPGTLSPVSLYTVAVPGTWTVVTKDNNSSCETRIPITVLQNTFAPDVSAIVPQQVLDCVVRNTVLTGQSKTPNVSFTWNFPTTPGSQSGDTLGVGVSAASNQSLIANYTLVVQDKSSTCSSASIIPMYQNTYPPNAMASNGGTKGITCKTPTIMLTNQSSSTIPPSTGFPNSQPAIGYIWQGPTPQVPDQVSTSYVAATPGTYTLVAKDLNNGCLASTTLTIDDERDYPIINNPLAAGPFTLDCNDQKDTKVNIYSIVSNSGTALTYSWTAPVNATVSGVNTPTLTTNTLGFYRITVTNTLNGCASNAQIKVLPGFLSGEFIASRLEGFAPLVVTFTNTSKSSLNNNNITSVWSFGNGTSSVTTSPNAVLTNTYSQPGTYKVTVYASKGSCADTVEKTIVVDIPSELEVPNIFTPNDDGVNDLFFLKANNLTNIEMVILDRWGHEVYKVSSSTGNVLWDGKNQAGQKVADGVYFYTIKASGSDGSSYDKNGSITLNR